LKVVNGEKMKKILMMLVLFSFTLPVWAKHKVVEAEVTPTPTTVESPWYAGIGAGVDQPLTNWNTGYALGFGGSFFVGSVLEGPWAAQIDIDPFFYSSGGTNLGNARFLAQIKYTFAGQGWQSYVLAGPGLVFQSLSPGSFSTVNFAAAAGVGVQFDLDGKLHLFVEAKDNFILPQGPAQMDIPMTAGLWTGL
jgi:hypothetical protein